MAQYILIQNGRIVRSHLHTVVDADMLLQVAENGESAVIERVAPAIGRETVNGTVRIVNAGGNLITPCFADLSCVLREPGTMYRQSITKAIAAAQSGGFDTVLAYYEFKEGQKPSDILHYWHEYPKHPAVSFVYTAPITAPDGAFSDTAAVFSYPDTALTNRFVPTRPETLFDAMLASAEANRTFFLYPNLSALSDRGAVDRHVAPSLRVGGISPVAEEAALAEALLIAEDTSCRLHVSGVSTAKSVSLIRGAKMAGIDVTSDTSPLYFFFSDNELLFRGLHAKVMPPLRRESDRLAVIEGIRDGTIDAIASHHVPFAERDYEGRTLSDAPFGAVGLETVLAASVEGLLTRGIVTIVQLIDLISGAPRRILAGMGCQSQTPRFEVGECVNFNIVSLDRPVTVTSALFKNRAMNTPFMMSTLQGRVEKTFRNGIELK